MVCTLMNIPNHLESSIVTKLKILYGSRANDIFAEVKVILSQYYEILTQTSQKRDRLAKFKRKFGYQDLILNSYADSIQGESGTPLQILYQFTEQYIKGYINGIHILPFYPWDTDRGFSVLNYYEIDPSNGSWDDFSALQRVFDVLMVDCVLNHASVDNPIIQKALYGDREFKDFVVTFNTEEKPTDDVLLKITRARPSPVLTQYYVINEDNKKRWASFNKPLQNTESKKVLIEEIGWVWTTFSRPDNPDGTAATRQVDLNYANPQVLLEFINIILLYISKGARWLRLDAICYLWKKLGTSCIHLPEVHIIIQIFNDIFKILDHLQILLVGEINEPQEKAFQYHTTEEEDKCDLVYLFAHYPLAVHSILTGTSKYYMNWLPSLLSAKGRLFISVLGTHDGMGMKPIGNWLPETEKKRLQSILIEKYGALPNYAILPGGEKIVYELCSTPWNLVNRKNTNEPLSLQIDRYLAVLALGLLIKGVPSLYINGLLGIPNYEGDLDENRTINRQILSKIYLDEKLNDKNSQMYTVFSKMLNLIKIRTNEKAFDPAGQMGTYPINDAVVSSLISSFDDKDKIFSVVNVSNKEQFIRLDTEVFGAKYGNYCTDIITGLDYEVIDSNNELELLLKPYQIYWLKKSR